ncbi:ribosomal protein S35, mitochondrial protein [Pseudohyphozyma bogoriensis]|nr:ribosomal protein S35, mitochondrial protein [Pseudohyphozyma bogoriensis]
MLSRSSRSLRAACSSSSSSSAPLTRPFSVSRASLSDDAAASSSSSPTDDAQAPTDAAESGSAPVVEQSEGKGKGQGYRAWLKDEGLRFRDPLKGRTNWIGDTPFPLNPTFSPRAPLADSLKTRIYNAYRFNILKPEKPSDSVVVRAVAQKFGVGMDRVRAVVRLKELEQSWKEEGIPLQTELLKGMESCLGVTTPGEHWKGVELTEAEQTTLGKLKTAFEMVDLEGNDTSVFLPLLAEQSAARIAASDETSTKKAPREPVRIVVPASRPGRAATVFEDHSKTWQGKVLKESRTKPARRGNRRGEAEAEQSV